MKANALCFFLLLSSLRAALGAISVSGFGPVVTFDTLPSPAEWAGRSMSGAALDIANEAALDATVQTITAGSITNVLHTDGFASPTPHGNASWSSPRQSVYTGPAGVAANMIMATLRNDSGSARSLLHVSYDLGVVPGAAPPEEIPGQRVYFSLSGLQNSWQLIPQFSGDTNAGLRDSWIQLGSWPAGTLLYLLWVQDNASHSPDACYTIDNFAADFIICDSFYWMQPFSDVTVAEGGRASFSISLCPHERFAFQWFKNGVAIQGAMNRTLEFPRVEIGDGGTYHTTFNGMMQSRHATLTVVPDEEPPRATLAYQVEDSDPDVDTIVVFFSEPVETDSASNVENYWLHSNAASSPPPFVFEASAVNETNVVLLVDRLAGGIQYFVTISNVTDRSAARHLLSPNPTTLDVRTFQPIISADYPWKYFEAPANTNWLGWTESNFDDGSWPTGMGVLGFPIDEILPAPYTVQTVIRSASGGGPNTTYFRTHFALSPGETNAVVQLSGVFDDGAVVYLNGRELWRVRLPQGFLTTSTFATSAPEPHLIDGPVSFYSPGLLRAGVNTLAVEVHQSSTVNGDVIMGLAMQLSRGTPHLTVARTGTNAVSINWTSGGTLQVSSIVGGPLGSWRDVVTQTNSFTTNVTSSGALFFRVRR